MGSNLGDRYAILCRALDGLARLAVGRRLVASRLYETDPVGGPPQPAYLNAVASFETEGSPGELWAGLQELERAAGRRRREPNGPRTLDLDLLCFGAACLETPELIVPHPRLHERAFVLVPLAEVAPNWVHPLLQETAATLAARFRSASGVRVWEPVAAPKGGPSWPSPPSVSHPSGSA
ncbi:MAG: 2-amino-4-hydroxy-6-hydroxymethyldihydropteridine diphosphokinase [Proteobacteria bacterium]|nr:2-amino-4-hydroxy-6-hydroxymethyldihydropteridine diphosphokinase [Pseudomonadota bacterium]